MREELTKILKENLTIKVEGTRLDIIIDMALGKLESYIKTRDTRIINSLRSIMETTSGDITPVSSTNLDEIQNGY